MTITRVSVNSAGDRAIGSSVAQSISADGRFLAFQSSASNLVPGDTNNKDDIFVRDLSTNTTTRVSVAGAGNQGNDSSALEEPRCVVVRLSIDLFSGIKEWRRTLRLRSTIIQTFA